MINPDHVKEIRRRGGIIPSDAKHYAELLKDPIWRIFNHYVILTKPNEDGVRSKIKFSPNEAQCELLYWVFVLDRRWINILKARQLGFTTLIQIIGLDMALNSPNANIKFVSQTDDVAKSTFSEKAILAYNALDRDYLDYLQESYGTPIAKINESSIKFSEGWGLFTYVSLRGGTSTLVHLSELGPMSADNMGRAQEVFAGAMETAALNSYVFIESTFKGGQHGIYYENTKKALDRGQDDRPKGQFWFMFFPWYEHSEYRIDDPAQPILDSTIRYFDQMRMETGYDFDRGQMLWWQTKEDRLGMLMKQENPTTPEEAMSAPTEGSIYADDLVQLQKDGRQCNLAVDRSIPSYAVWDIGKRDRTAIWVVQFRDGWVHWIHHISGSRMEPEEYVDKVKDLNVSIDKHILPHDAKQERAGGSWSGILRRYGVKNQLILPKTNDKWVGIRALQGLLKRSKFCLGTTDDGFDALMCYRSEIDIKNGIMKAVPVHDWTSDTADSARYVAEAILTGRIKEKSPLDHQIKMKENYERRIAVSASRGFKNKNWWD